MTQKIRFIKEDGDKQSVPNHEDYLLLADFLNDFKRYYFDDQEELIHNFELIQQGIKTFNEVHDPSISWNFGNQGYFLPQGYLEIDNGKVYLDPEKEKTESKSVCLELSEFIDLLKKWNFYLK